MPKGSAIIADDAVTSAARDAGARELFAPATRTARVALALAGGLAMGSAWLFPGSVMAAVLWSVATFVLVTLALDRQRGQYGMAFLAGITGCALAFHWVFRTIADFSGLPDLVSAVLHALFLASAALEFVLFVFFARHLGAWAARFALTTPIAWIAAETLMPRVFPWEPAHTQLAWLPLVQVAELAGSPLVGFLLFWFAEAVMRGVATRRWLPLVLPALSLTLALGWGTYRLGEIRAVNAPQQPVALLQANMQIEQQGGVKRVGIDTQRYLDLTRQVNDPAALVVWPESALQAVVPADIGDRHRFERFDALFPTHQPMLVGTMTIDHQRHRYNSALALLADGRIPAPYHKRILMPFGETMPFLKLFPWLATLNASFVPIDAGERAVVFRYSDVLAASPLICYEDLVPAMSREATLAGATLLVNLTNDVWFGDTVAPRQHNLIASFRAIENRRWLVRATNTGTTSVVSPTGETVAALPGFSEGTLRANVGLLAGETLYTRYLGDKLWWAIALLACATSAWHWRTRRQRP